MGDKTPEEPRRSESPDFDFAGGRPLITTYQTTSKYRPGQVVYLRVPGQLQLEGPFKVATVPRTKKYTLCRLDGQQARNGEEVDEEHLTDSSGS